MNLKTLLQESKSTSDFIDRWILFLWNNRNALNEQKKTNKNITYIEYSSSMKKRILDKFKDDSKFIDLLLETADKIEHENFDNSKDFSKMTDREFFEWTLEFFIYVIEAFNTLLHRYSTPHLTGKVYSGIEYKMLVDRIHKINNLYKFCRSTLMEEIKHAGINKMATKEGSHYIFTTDHTIEIKPNDETAGDGHKATPEFIAALREEFPDDNIIII